jgi:hypothetical protein
MDWLIWLASSFLEDEEILFWASSTHISPDTLDPFVFSILMKLDGLIKIHLNEITPVRPFYDLRVDTHSQNINMCGRQQKDVHKIK